MKNEKEIIEKIKSLVKEKSRDEFRASEDYFMFSSEALAYRRRRPTEYPKFLNESLARWEAAEADRG